MGKKEFDVILRGGELVDGMGSPRYLADVAIKEGFIVEIGSVRENAEFVLDVNGLVVAPGFIDTHSHSDLFLIHEPQSMAKIMQGITTEIIGQDGLGEAPIRDDLILKWRKYLSGLNGDPPIKWTWNNFSDYLDRVQRARPSVNVASLVGHGNLRLVSMGMDNIEPSKDEMMMMKTILSESLRQGAIGLSTGLIYAPCIYSKVWELVELCKVTAQFNGVFVVHMRNEGDKLIESIDEVLEVGRKSGAHVHISHFKVQGEANWGKSKLSLKKLEDFNVQGVKVSFDQYPYTAGSTFLSSLLPAWVHEGGVDQLLERLRDLDVRKKIINMYNEKENFDRATRWDRVLVTYIMSDKNKMYEGFSIRAIAEKRGQAEVETLIDLVLEEENQASMASFSMSEEDIRRIMAHPLGMFCTDGLLLGKPHPRAYGAFPRVLGRYVKEEVFGLEEAIRKMTSYPAQTFNINKRGILQPGFYADITVFNPETIEDMSTFQEPRIFPKGISHVLVNGVITVENGRFNGIRAGKVLRNNSAHAI
jgi:N-acyl-D-amino-acid deacylase